MKRKIKIFIVLLIVSVGASAQTILRTSGGGIIMTSGNKVGMAPAAQDLKIGDSYQGGIIFYLDAMGVCWVDYKCN